VEALFKSLWFLWYMATGAGGIVSLEIAVLMSVVLVIATAVGWYLYTTFVASTVGQPRLGWYRQSYLQATAS
jgi:uncharacterized protein (UPF0333 family)